LLAEAYDKLLSTDAGNLKALRYFKLVFTQSNEWEEVTRILKALLQNVTYPQEIYRVAQELAAVLLYQLNEPREALRVLDTHCSDSPLDTSTILYDAYETLGDLDGCLRILRQCLLSVSDDSGRSKLLYKIATIEEQRGDKSSALKHYTKSFEVWPSLLDAAEGIVSIAIEQKNWPLLEETLISLYDKIQDGRLRGQIEQATKRLKNGVEHATHA
jgi:tetratricopeptide (TPR) repeat protein